MSAHIVFAVPCLWRWGIHSLQGLPSILLIKQWLCTQPIQGRENATQRDKNIKHSAIWGGRVPNNDSLVIMEALFFFSPVTPQKIVDEGGICVSIDLTMHSCDVGQILLSCVKKKQTHEIFNVGKKAADSKPLLSALTHFRAIYFPLPFVATRAGHVPDLTKARH